MSTPSGWYDDGSGDLRWWDGVEWTAHVRSTATATPPPQQAAEEVSFTPPYAMPTPAAHSADATFSSAGHSDAPTSAYPGALPMVPSATPARRVSVLGLVGLIAAVIGVVIACVPPIAVVGWVVLGLAFVASVVSLFLRGSKWPGFTGIGVTVFGTVLAVAVSLVSLGIGSVVEADRVPVATPSDAPSSEDDPVAEEPATDPSAIEDAQMVSFEDLSVGDCLPLVEYDADEDIYELPVVPCERPHTDEVFFIYDVEDGEFPGDEALYDLAWEGCLAEFEPFVGTPYEESELDFYPYTPTKSSWIRGDDRTVHCIVFSYEDVTGTLEGAVR